MAEIGSNLIQSFEPIKQIDMHMCGFAFYKDDPTRQVISLFDTVHSYLLSSLFRSSDKGLLLISDIFLLVELHHFCSRLSDDFIQCAVYDSDR